MTETGKKPMQFASGTSAEVIHSSPVKDDPDIDTLNREQLQIIHWLKEVRFRKKLFGGVNEQDVWKKIEKLNEMYDDALKAERIRYNVLLEEQGNLQEPDHWTGDPKKEPSADE